MLGNNVDRQLAVASAQVEPIGVVMRLFRRTAGGSPNSGTCITAGRAIGEFIHCTEMNRAQDEAILYRVVPTTVVGVAAAGHRAVIPDVGKSISSARRIVKQHGIGAETPLTTESQRAKMLRRDAGIEFVIERLACTRAVDGFRVAGSGKAVVGGVGGGRVGEQARLRIDASGSVEHYRPPGEKLFPGPDAQPCLLQIVRCDKESVLIAVSVHQRFAFIVVAVN